MNRVKIRLLRWAVKVAACLGAPSDKLLHFVCAMVLMIVLSVLTNMCVGYGITMAICIGKEIWDVYKPNPTGFSLGDFLADLLGIVVGMVMVMTV